MQNEDKQITLNEKEFQQLFNSFYSPLCRFAAGYLYDAGSAEEIVQQVFVNLWYKRNSIDPDKAVKTYLFTSVKNRCLNYIRDQKKYRNYYLDVEAELEIPINERDLISESDLEKQVKKAIEKLPEKCREIFLLCRFEDMKYKEVAKKLNISEKTVEAQMSKALKIMREELKDYYFLLLLFWFTNFN